MEYSDLSEVARFHMQNGGTNLFYDEVHYQRRWQTMIKNLTDSFPKLNIVYTGSSVLKNVFRCLFVHFQNLRFTTSLSLSFDKIIAACLLIRKFQYVITAYSYGFIQGGLLE